MCGLSTIVYDFITCGCIRLYLYSLCYVVVCVVYDCLTRLYVLFSCVSYAYACVFCDCMTVVAVLSSVVLARVHRYCV